MKKIGKTILILLLIVFLCFLGLFIVRAKQSNELKSGLLREDSNGIIQQVVWGGNDLSINVNGPQTVLRIPISSVVPETLTWKNFKFRLNLYDENGEKLDYVFLGEKGIPSGVSHSPVVDLIFKDSILGMKEFKMPVGAISRINEDTFQVELEDFDGYADMAGDDIRYKIFGKGKIDSVYLEIFHGNNVKLEFAIIDDEAIIEDYCEGAECKDSYPWEIEDLYGTYKLVGFNYEITDIPATLTISEKLIGAKFCNDMGSDNYSIGDNYIHVNNMSQTEMLCDSEKLMEYESKFDLSNAKISLVERNLRLTTPNGDIYDFFKNNEESIIEPEILDEEGTTDIPLDGLVYRNDEYGFQIKFGKERSGGKIYDSFRKYNIYNYNTDYDGGIKNPFIVFTVPSPRRTGKFENIADIIVYTYEEYEQARQNQMDPECLMCSLEEFDKAIVGKNNKYYFLLGRSNRSDDELKTIFPSLECREEIDDNIYSHNYGGSYIYCDGLEYINGEPKKTGKDWVEQLFPAESFEFFDVKENAENNEFLEDIKSNGAQPQRINDYPEETENLNVLDITDKTMDTEYLINLTIGDKNFDVILENNSATRALYEKLKEGNVVINAKEYGGFEKVGNLGFSLPREDKQIKTQLGDLVLYNGNQVSLFYDNNSWSYTKLGKVQNITESDFGDGDITLTFSLKK